MNYIRFDWAIKKLLRQKANFVVLEGLLTTIFGEKVTINRILESEGNQELEDSKFNRVDILAENSKGELIIVEVQNSRELDYFHRILFGACKAVTEYISAGDPYKNVKKVYSINIVYFSIGQGADYVYHGKTNFVGVHKHDELRLSPKQKEQFSSNYAADIFPEYYILRVNEFDDNAKTPLDEWISFLKTGQIPEKVSAAGLSEAKNILAEDKMTEKERSAYKTHLENLRYERSVIYTGYMDGRSDGLAEGRAEGREEGRAEGREEGRAEGREEGRAEGRAEGIIETNKSHAKAMRDNGIQVSIISQITGLTVDEIEKL